MLPTVLVSTLVRVTDRRFYLVCVCERNEWLAELLMNAERLADRCLVMSHACLVTSKSSIMMMIIVMIMITHYT